MVSLPRAFSGFSGGTQGSVDQATLSGVAEHLFRDFTFFAADALPDQT